MVPIQKPHNSPYLPVGNSIVMMSMLPARADGFFHTHSSGKDVSHYVAYFKLKTVTPLPPVDQPINGPLPIPEFRDYCGTANDLAVLPTNYDVPVTYVLVDQDTVRAVANPGHFIALGVVTEWSHKFDTTPCPIFIVDQPPAPTLCNGQIQPQADTNQYFYGMDDYNAYIIAKDGHLFQQDIITSWPISSFMKFAKSRSLPLRRRSQM